MKTASFVLTLLCVSVQPAYPQYRPSASEVQALSSAITDLNQKLDQINERKRKEELERRNVERRARDEERRRWVPPRFGVGGDLQNAEEIPVEFRERVARSAGKSVEQLFGHLTRLPQRAAVVGASPKSGESVERAVRAVYEGNPELIPPHGKWSQEFHARLFAHAESVEAPIDGDGVRHIAKSVRIDMSFHDSLPAAQKESYKRAVRLHSMFRDPMMRMGFWTYVDQLRATGEKHEWLWREADWPERVAATFAESIRTEK